MPLVPDVSSTTEGLSTQVFSSLVDRARASGRRVYPLHIGDTYREPPPHVHEQLQTSIAQRGAYSYARPAGEPSLIDVIRHKLMLDVGFAPDADCIQVMAGATAGLSIVVQALINPFEEVLIPAPHWPLIRGIVSSRGAVPVECPFWDRLHEPSFDAERALELAITPQTVALYLNHPNNPTGQMLSADHREAVVRVAQRHRLWLLCDETYEDLRYDEDAATRTWLDNRVHGQSVVTHTLSKAYAVAGIRVGYTHGPKAAMRAIQSVQAFQAYGVAKPMQYLAERILLGSHAWLQQTREAYREAATRVTQALRVPDVRSGSFVFFDTRPYRKPDEDSDAFFERCASAGMLLMPGAAAGQSFKEYARLCFTAVPPGDLSDALDVLSKLIGR